MGKRSESSWRRAWNDSERFRKESPWWYWGSEVIGGGLLAVVFGVVGVSLAPTNASATEATAYSGIGGFIGFVAGLSLVFGIILLWNFVRVPYRQRDKAMTEVAQLRGQLDTKTDRKELRLALGRLSENGSKLLVLVRDHGRDEKGPLPDKEATEWAHHTELFLMEKFGEDYVARFRNPHGLPVVLTRLLPPYSNVESYIQSRLARLSEFMAELVLSQ